MWFYLNSRPLILRHYFELIYNLWCGGIIIYFSFFRFLIAYHSYLPLLLPCILIPSCPLSSISLTILLLLVKFSSVEMGYKLLHRVVIIISFLVCWYSSTYHLFCLSLRKFLFITLLIVFIQTSQTLEFILSNLILADIRSSSALLLPSTPGSLYFLYLTLAWVNGFLWFSLIWVLSFVGRL